MTITTGTFFVASAVAAIVVGVAARAAPRPVTRGLYYWALIAGAGAIAITIANANGWMAAGSLFQILVFRGWLVIGAALAALALLLAGRTAFAASPELRRALCISVALGFVQVSIGKLAHDAEMRAFFAFSGLPIWLHYAVMAVEIVGAIGLLVPRWARVAALPLMVMMTGAIGTHARNGDPLMDSLEAIHNLIVLACFVVIARPHLLSPRDETR